MAASPSLTPVTQELDNATVTLSETVCDFREAIKQLAAMNGHGEPIRRKIRNSLIGIKSKANGKSR